jgi:predicted ATPase/class 3 adenylate cyclase
MPYNSSRMEGLPAGTVTFLFTDVEGSTRLWEEQPDEMAAMLASHDSILRAAIESNGGYVFKTVGDAFCAAFPSAIGAVAASLESQIQLNGKLKVRMAIHAGVAQLRDGDYFGQPLNRVARLLSAGHGGQVLLSTAAKSLAEGRLPDGSTLASLGEHRLKDLSNPDEVFQLAHPKLPDCFPPLLSLENLHKKHNLPLQLTSFIGREREVRETLDLVDRSRMVTLTGSGGCGKTRLALQAAAQMLDGSAGGAWLVELAAEYRPEAVATQVGQTLNVQERPDEPMKETLAKRIGERQMLLLLDNCEHLLDACAELAEYLLRHCPNLSILATSREALGIAGETSYRVPSLDSSEAVGLFFERAVLAKPDFEPDEAVASICRRLDGIPLAIELAASRVRHMPPAEIEKRLDQRFQLLTGGSRTSLPRQQTLRSLIDWSYSLLSKKEKLLFERLSVFVGGWTLEAAEKVASGEAIEDWEVMDLHSSLVDKSLVTVEGTRFKYLETVRQFAREKCLDNSDLALWRNRHLAYFVEFAEFWEPHTMGAKEKEALDTLEADRENLVVAVEWAKEVQLELAYRIMSATVRLWFVRGPVPLGYRQTERLIPTIEASSLAAVKLFTAASHLAHGVAGLEASRQLAARANDIAQQLPDRYARAIGEAGVAFFTAVFTTEPMDFAAYEALADTFAEFNDPPQKVWALYGIATGYGIRGVPQAEAAFGLAFDAIEQIQWRSLLAGLKNNLGYMNVINGDFDRARELFEESREIHLSVGEFADLQIYNLAQLELCCDNLAESAQLTREFLDWTVGWGQDNERPFMYITEHIANLASKIGNVDVAARIWGVANSQAAKLGDRLESFEQDLHDKFTAIAREQMGDEAFEAAWKEGEKLSRDQILMLLDSVLPGAPPRN